VGDVASPLRDPALDYLTGAWIGGRVDSMDLLLTLANEQTRIVPAYGPVMSKAEFKAERDVMEEVRKRLFDQVREGDSPRDMLERGVLKGLARTWNDPYKFLYDAAKGLWAHHDKLGPMSCRRDRREGSLSLVSACLLPLSRRWPVQEFAGRSHSSRKPEGGARQDSHRSGCE
jgi:hypothetical protein